MPDCIGRFRVRNGAVEIAVLDWGGEGPPALLHHANGLCAATLGPLAALLRGRYRVFGMDARGHGDSTVLDDPRSYVWPAFQGAWIAVAEHIRGRCGAPLALALGHSLGGTTTMLGAAARPELVRNIALVEAVIPVHGALGTDDPARVERRRRLIEGARKRRSRWPSRGHAREHFAARRFFSSWRAEALNGYVEAGLRDAAGGEVELKCPGAVEAAIFENGKGLDAIAEAAAVRCPAVWMWARDGDFSRDLYERAAAGMSCARVVDVEGGHMVPMEAPERIAAALEA